MCSLTKHLLCYGNNVECSTIFVLKEKLEVQRLKHTDGAYIVQL